MDARLQAFFPFWASSGLTSSASMVAALLLMVTSLFIDNGSKCSICQHHWVESPPVSFPGPQDTPRVDGPLFLLKICFLCLSPPLTTPQMHFPSSQDWSESLQQRRERILIKNPVAVAGQSGVHYLMTQEYWNGTFTYFKLSENCALI